MKHQLQQYMYIQLVRVVSYRFIVIAYKHSSGTQPITMRLIENNEQENRARNNKIKEVN